ncbi:hypothetical protein KM043_012984 [Ampulex compressa]|nr:hypothetical protein KM043_012984 [Ampulex compressa]
MEARDGVVDEGDSLTGAERAQNSSKEEDKSESPEKIRVLSVDKVTLEKIVLESSNGSREVFLTKNETSRKLSLRSEAGKRILRRAKDEGKEASWTNGRLRGSAAEEAPLSKLGGSFKNGALGQSRPRRATNAHQGAERRIKPIRLTKTPSIGSIVVGGLKSASLLGRRGKAPPKVPLKPEKLVILADSEEVYSLNKNLVVDKRQETSVEEEGTKEGESKIEETLQDKPIIEDSREPNQEIPETEGKREKNVLDKTNEIESNDVDSIALEEENDGKEERLKTPPENIDDDKNLNQKIDEEIRTEDPQEKVDSAQACSGSPPKNPEENLDRQAQDLLERSQTNIEVLQQNLGTRINASTVQLYKERLPDPSTNYTLKLPLASDRRTTSFDKDFLERHNLDKRLKIEEKRLLETDLDEVSEADATRHNRPRYSDKVTEVEKRWSGEFLESGFERNSSESSKSSYVEEFGSVSSRESVVEDRARPFFERRPREEERSPVEEDARRASEETLENSTVSTVDSDSCLEDRIKAVEEDIEERAKETQPEDEVEDLEVYPEERFDRLISKDSKGLAKGEARRDIEKLLNRGESRFAIRKSSRRDGYASLIKEFAMEPGRGKKEEKQKKKLGLRRLLPGFFSPKDSRKDYKKKEQKERKRQDERHFARYQQNGNYTRSPDTMNLNEDIKRNVKLDNSLNGSIIEERLNEIKRELFPEQGPITSTPDHFAQTEEQSLLRDRSGVPRSYTTNSSLSSIAPDERWLDRTTQLGISPDIKKYEQRQKREELDSRRYGQLERKHSLQEPRQAPRPCFLQRNHGPSGRISAPPSERYLVRPRAIHPVDRPLPAIPHSRVELSNYDNYHPNEIENYRKNLCPPEKVAYVDRREIYSGRNQGAEPPGLVLTSVSAQVKITRQPIVNQNQRAPLVGRSPKYPSPGSSQKSGDYADSSCTPNSSQKSEFSPSSSKSGEYYLHSPRNSARTSPCDREGIYENEGSSTGRYEERVYDETPREKECSRAALESSPNRAEEGESRKNREQACNLQAEALREHEKAQEAQRHREEAPKNTPPSNQGERPQGNVSSPGNKSTGPTSPGSHRVSSQARRSQPNDQILIASPKREMVYEGSRVSRPSNEFRGIDSPVPMTSSPQRHPTVEISKPRNPELYGSNSRAAYHEQTTPLHLSKDLPRPEPIYARRKEDSRVCASSSSPPEKRENQSSVVPSIPQETPRGSDDRVAWVQAASRNSESSPAQVAQLEASNYEKENRSPIRDCSVQTRRQEHRVEQLPASTSQEKASASRAPGDEQPTREKLPRQVNQRLCEPVYVQQAPATTGPLSPSKRETRQHLEAFYWQQKALEAHRKSTSTPMSCNPRQPRIDLPEVREAVYWQQLKRLDEEQQRRIYEQNPMDDRAREYYGSALKSPVIVPSKQVPSRSNVPVTIADQSSQIDRCYWDKKPQRGKITPAGKPPLMQKGQNQPVLIVRPQQAIKERHHEGKLFEAPRQETQRSKSASPHFHSGETDPPGCRATSKQSLESNSAQVLLRKPASTQDEEVIEEQGKPAPPPIFKRGSLVGGESIEYGSTGPKRVSFSSQAELAPGNWPTKHGTAPEPPTRRHRSEDSTSDTDSVFVHQEQRREQDGFHASRGTELSSRCRPEEAPDYDANRPLPPTPMDPAWASRRGHVFARNGAYNEARFHGELEQRIIGNPGNYRRCPGNHESESGSELATEEQGIYRRRQGK